MALESTLWQALLELTRELGFAQAAATPATRSTGFDQLERWLEAGFAGEMDYFENRLAAYQHPSGVLPEVRSLLMLRYPYPAGVQAATPDGFGRVARYLSLDGDYHDLIHPKLKAICRFLEQHAKSAHSRGVVDTAPLLEREWAELAGLGWRAKNTLLIDKYSGSYFLLACVLTDIELPSFTGIATDHCGTCQRCIDACPTEAFPQPGVLDASQCISYLTIEHRSPIPMELREGIGNWLFGCDICQEVCPWNTKQEKISQRTSKTSTTEQTMARAQLELTELFRLTEEEFRARFRKSPIWRAKRRGLLRNAAIVLGNTRNAEFIPALSLAAEDPEALVRGAAAWGLGRIDDVRAMDALKQWSRSETDSYVQEEISQALLAHQKRPKDSHRGE